MSYDLYVAKPQGDAATRLRLLVTNNAPLPNYLSLMHGQFDKKTKKLIRRGDFNQYIADELNRLQLLGLNLPAISDIAALPPGSWFLQFTFTLAKPWISKDDDPFYVAESVNPVRKDKVFKVPMMSAASWKGLLRWTAMHTRLVLKKDALSPEKFAQERFVQTLLFGDEKGEEPGQTKDFAAYLDALKPEARQEYERLLRAYYELEPDEPLPHHSGRLMFYPTFFDLIDVEVINPHSRKTRAGTHPIYLECVPQGAKGTFSLLYVPFDLVGQNQESIVDEAGKHLRYLVPMIKHLFLTYGFSAKRTSGYGVAEDEIVKVEIRTRADRLDLEKTKLSDLQQEVGSVRFA
jgi:CRISPR-associated protein Cmr2